MCVCVCVCVCVCEKVELFVSKYENTSIRLKYGNIDRPCVPVTSAGFETIFGNNIVSIFNDTVGISLQVDLTSDLTQFSQLSFPLTTTTTPLSMKKDCNSFTVHAMFVRGSCVVASNGWVFSRFFPPGTRTL